MKKVSERIGAILDIKAVLMTLSYLTVAVLCFYVDVAFAASSDTTLSQVAQNLTHPMKALAKMITAGSYVAGFGFAIGAILKFKAHKDNPTQIPVGTPIALLFIAAALIFLPSVFGVAGHTMFGANPSTGGVSGTTSW